MSIVLDQLTKRYGSLAIVDQVSLEVADGELFVLVGASGSGKSTILRLIAGLTLPTTGRILLHGRDVTALPPQQRGIGFVFQNYSIFRHMSVADNIEFGLKIRKVPKATRVQRREELLDLVDLAGLGSRYASQLSGGQQQRVALARALAYEPAVLLLDEPFGALDVKIRAQLRRTLKEIQQRLGVTTILVTHDQEEAFELADRIGIVERGQLLETEAPEQLYARPQSLFVATFLGSGTILAGRAEAGHAHFGPLHLSIPAEMSYAEGDRVQVLFRPEQVALTAEPPTDDRPVVGQGEVIEQHFAGPLRRVRVRLPHLPGRRQISPPLPFGEEGLLVDAVLPADVLLPSQAPWVSVRSWHVLAPSTWRLLVYDLDAGPTTSLVVARHLVEQMPATATVLGVASEPDRAEALRLALEQRQQEVGLCQAELRMRHGGVAEQIAFETHETLYELLILAASDRPDTHPHRLGSTAMTLLENPPLPILVTKREQTRFGRILICTAVGEPGKQDIRVGGWLASRLGAHATVLHVSREASVPSPLARAHLERAVSTLRALEVPSEFQVRSAIHPAAGILQEVRTGSYDLVVLGSHGPISRSILGRDDVTLQVLANIDVPVLVVPAEVV